MIVGYFGLPGAGKTTVLAMKAQQALHDIARGVSKYKCVYTNFDCVGCYRITFSDLDQYIVSDCLILFDELMLDADNRGFKSFPLGVRDFLTLHRHKNVDIIYATQAYDKIDIKIRGLTAELWYMCKSIVPVLSHFTLCRRIYRNMDINEYQSEIVYGYRFCNLIEKFFASNNKLCFRPKYYKYFDSFDELQLKGRPELPAKLWNKDFKPSKLDYVFAKAAKFRLRRSKAVH